MARNTKYYTQADRQAARREQKARYARSELGKTNRAAARARAQEHNAAAIACELTSKVPTEMRAYAARPFVMSFAFRETGGPALGLQKPPYTFRLPDDRSLRSLERRGSEDPVAVKLHTLQFTWAIEAAYARRTEWSVKSTDQVIELAEAELKARVRAWKLMEARTLQAGIEGDIREVAMCWGARRATMVADELEIRRKGRDAYLEARRTGQTPLQKLVKENNFRIEQIPDEADSEEE
ncbi:hypothetical protein K466DRAFT_569396 [Polyporus arcularius HHB13444]|uniref:Uncharacterized protein n=1 Tax=Polyporus arcularius HHB13444 TaxID=1314778 RepID=A0A5C3NWE6_9APHY|nr:hypothetical protein K466DRAFT_569396 [Polyporus arcularius HHB13444]